MPTPFTHLQVAQKLLADPVIPVAIRDMLEADRSAFLLGNIVADARTQSGINRSDTHFYRYDVPMADHPWRLMLAQHPALTPPDNTEHKTFIAGYVAHLAMDEVWTLNMLGPHFFEATWGEDRRFRFFMLHTILAYMDERDYDLLDSWQAEALAAAVPLDWLPFLPDAAMLAWRDYIHEQLVGESQTLAIFSQRLDKPVAEFRAELDSPERLQADLWANVPRAVLDAIEDRMYAFAREQMLAYLDETAVG
jgi:hypothetical protein